MREKSDLSYPLRLRLTHNQRAWLRLEASRRGTSASQVMRDLVRVAMDRSRMGGTTARAEQRKVETILSKLAPELGPDDNV